MPTNNADLYEMAELRAENERLKEELGYCQIQRDDARYGSEQHLAEVERLRAALASLIRAGANGSAEFDTEARRIEREVLGA
jgi:septal ring factor EnvC (AmiA/AmiB activator)